MALPSHLRDLFNPLRPLSSEEVLHSLFTPSLHSLFISSLFTSSISLHSPHSIPTSHSLLTASTLFPHSLLAPHSLFLVPFSHCSLFNCSSSRHICSPVFGLFILQPCIHEFPRPSRYISGSRQQDASSIFRGPLADLGTGKITSEAQKAVPLGLLASKSSADH
jgi:hypothetical protein